MFKLVNRRTSTDALSRVEDLVNVSVDVQYTHITYETKESLYEGELKPNKYFTHIGFIEAVSENLNNLQFIDGHAVYHLIDITMVEIPKPHDIDAMLKTIDDQQKEIAMLRDVIDRGQLFDVRVLDQYTLVDPIIGNCEIDGIKYNLYNINREFKLDNKYTAELYELNTKFLGGTDIGKFHKVVKQSICNCGSSVLNAYITPNKLITFTLRGTLFNAGGHNTPDKCNALAWEIGSYVNYHWPRNPIKYMDSDGIWFLQWLMMNIHVLYRRYIRYVFSTTADFSVYISVDRLQPYEPIWRVNDGKPFIIYK